MKALPPISRLLFRRFESVLGRIGNNSIQRRSVDESGKEVLPVLNVKRNEESAHFLPQVGLGMLGAQRLLKKDATVRLDLVDGKGQ